MNSFGGFGGRMGGFGGFGGMSPFGNLFGGNSGSQAKPPIRARLRGSVDVPAEMVRAGEIRTRQNIQSTPAQRVVNGYSASVEDGVARISGSASSDKQRRMAELLLRLEPGVRRVENNITVSIKPTQYKLLLNLEKASSNPVHTIDSAPILETLNYQEVGPNEDYKTYQDISSSSFIVNRPVKTIEFDNRAASVHWNAAQIMQYPLTNCVTVAGDHLVHFLVPKKANIIIVPPFKDQKPQP
jgi:hypothetical protein